MDISGPYARSVLGCPAGRGNNSIVARRLRAGADVAARTSTCETPLNFAARSEDIACVKMLVNAGSGLCEKRKRKNTFSLWIGRRQTLLEVLARDENSHTTWEDDWNGGYPQEHI
jgi:ankyrin repeat protein